MKFPILLLAGLLAWAPPLVPVHAQPPRPSEDAYYTISRFDLPEGEVLEAAGFQLLPNGQMAVCTRRGEIWLIDQPFAAEAGKAKLTRFAHGLHETLSLAYRDGWLYAVQRCEVTRIKDTNGDGRADLFETVNDGWGITGDYHEYAFGSKFDARGDLWVTLCLTGSFSSQAKYRGWCVRITPEGQLIPTCSGIRSPGGMGANASGDIFYTDNQGPWNGTCALKHLSPGKFMGHPGGFKWYEEPAARTAMGETPREPESGSRCLLEAEKIPAYEPPVILFPYDKMGKSASGIACDTSAGKFGPFTEQLFVGDQTFSTVMRVFLEKVNGHYQGACISFREGFGSGSLGLEMTPQGALFVGGTNRGWGSRGTLPFSIERLDWTGQIPFEIHEMRARPDGFELTFTQPIDAASARDLTGYKLSTYTYIYQSSYGSPEVDHTTPAVLSAIVSEDNTRIRLVIQGLQRGHVHELHLPDLRSQAGLPLLHPQAYYTLNHIPEK
ncbi:MAG: hypothetical protein KDA76_12570 [Planctomycetaceae bacterium]|nr:hypothetical protein [Planctomycetaceae bacterium]